MRILKLHYAKNSLINTVQNSGLKSPGNPLEY